MIVLFSNIVLRKSKLPQDSVWILALAAAHLIIKLRVLRLRRNIKAS